MKERKGLNSILGELEFEIMKIIWNMEKASVREVLLRLKKKRKIAYTTIMTVMSRLYDKGILKRELNDSGAYIYVPKHQDEKEFLAYSSQKAVQNIINEYGELAVSQFVDVIESSSSKNFKIWKNKLKKIKK